MYLRTKSKKGNRVGFYLVASSRKNGVPRQETVAYLGSVSLGDVERRKHYDRLADMSKFFDTSADYEPAKHEEIKGAFTRFWSKVNEKLRGVDWLTSHRIKVQICEVLGTPHGGE